MKKILIISALVLTIVSSIVAGTLASYNVNIGEVASGSVVAKAFKLTGAGLDSFQNNVLIAPTETKEMKFTVSNFDGSVVTETNMDVAITVDVTAQSGKQAIAPLTVVVKNESGAVVSQGSLANGVGTLTVADTFTANVQATKTYTVVINWPSTANDTQYAGAGFGNAIKVSVAGTQA